MSRFTPILSAALHTVACLDLSTPAFEETRLLMNLEEYAGNKFVFSGKMNVQFLLRIVISEEIERMDSCLELTVPLIDTFWSTELLQRFLNQKICMEIHRFLHHEIEKYEGKKEQKAA